jgi:hypothetical protein
MFNTMKKKILMARNKMIWKKKRKKKDIRDTAKFY